MNATFASGFRTGYYRAGGTSIGIKCAVRKIALKQLRAVTRCLVMSTLFYWLFQSLGSGPVNYYQILSICIGLMVEQGDYSETAFWSIRVGMFVGRALSVLTTAVLCLVIIIITHHLFG
jgi:hypothetical protein